MRGLLWLLVLAALAVALALGAKLNDGYVLLVLPPWRAEVSLNLLLLALFGAFVVSYFLLRGLALLLGMPSRIGAWQAQRQKDKAAQVFQDAVRLLFEGRFGQALKRAGEANAAGIAPGLSALIAARAAQRMRESEKQQGWLARAKIDDPKTEAATLMLEAEMAIEDRRFEAALAALARLQEKMGRHIAALRLELRARQGIGDWDGVLKLVRQLAKRDALAPEVVREMRAQAHLAHIAARAGDAAQLKAYLRQLPAEELGQRVALAAARALIARGAGDVAQDLIERQLDKPGGEGWQSELAALYGRLDGGDQTARIARADGWLRQQPMDAQLLLALGRMCRRQRLWGKAKTYLEASLAVAKTAEAHLELAHLLDQLDQADEANTHYRALASIDAR